MIQAEQSMGDNREVQKRKELLVNPTHLAKLLENAKAGHTAYNQIHKEVHGQSHDDWHGWYARHIWNDLSTLGVPITDTAIERMLYDVEVAYTEYAKELEARGETPEDWIQWYARYMHEQLTHVQDEPTETPQNS